MSQPENPLMPHSLDFVGQPWATRPTEYRSTSQTYVPDGLRVDMPGAPVYDAGAPVLKPVPYDWTGQGPAPKELYAMAADLATVWGDAFGPLPPITEPMQFAGWLQRVYVGLTTKGEGCGLDPDALDRAIIENAQLGPHAVAYAIQQLIRTSPLCNEVLIKRPLDPPPTTTHEVPTDGPITRTTPKPLEPTGVPKKSNALKWTLAGVGILAVIGGSIWYMTRAAKKRKNPCQCGNPLVAVGYEEEERENPYGGTAGFGSVDPGVLDHAALVSPVLRRNPSKKRRKAKS